MMADRGANDSSAKSSDDPLIGQCINDRYLIEQVLAQGGMGRVYRARQVPLGRTVALKVLQPNYHGSADPAFHKRFLLEAATCAKLKCANTVTIFDYGSQEGIYYIAMEYLEGRTLHHELRRLGHLPLARTYSIVRQMCRSLGEAHEFGVIHRDLKPANIVLVEQDDEDERDFVKIIDFGLVKEMDTAGEGLTKSGLFMGSPKYMSPEQIRNHELDPRSDIYAIGVVTYEMLTGRAPFVGKSDIDTLTAHLGQRPPPMSSVNPSVAVPAVVEGIVRKCLEKSPDQRFSTVEQLYEAFKAAITHTMSVTPTGPWLISQTQPIAPAEPASVGDDIPTATSEGLSDVSIVEPRQQRRLWVPLLFALAVAGLAGALALSDDAPPETTSPVGARAAPAAEVEVEPPPAPEPAPEPEPEPAPLRTVRLQLHTDPPGAMAIIHERLYGPTPAEIELAGDEYAEGQSLTVRFQKEGYRDHTSTLRIDAESLQVEATLEPFSRRVFRPRPSQQPPDPAPSMWSPI